MLLSQWLMVGIFLATFLGLVRFQKAPEKVFSFSILLCLVCGLVTTDEIFDNGVNSGLLSLVLLILCSFALERTSFLRYISVKLISKSATASYVKLLFGTALSSAVLNNTAIVATLITPLKNNKHINPGRLLLPLSYAAILGGTLTLVGTSTNLIVNSMVIEKGMASLAFFDFTLVGIGACLACFLVMALMLPRLPKSIKTSEQPQAYFIEAKVSSDSKLIGQSIEDNGLRNIDAFYLVEIIRQGFLISPVAPDERILAGDKLVFSGDVTKVKVLQQYDGLQLFAEQNDLLTDNLTEVLVKPGSSIAGLSLKQSGFRARFDAAVVAIRREGETLSGKLGEIVIRSGDFLVLAVGNDFRSRPNLSKNFFLLSGVKPENILSGWRNSYALLGFAASISASIALPFTLLECLLVYTAGLFAFNCISLSEIKRRFPFEIWLVVTCALSLSTAMENTGVSQLIADSAEHYLLGSDVMLAFVCVYLVTLVFTELVTNNAAAALIFPIAYNIALGLGVDPMPFIMAVAFAASGSFIMPWGYQTNLMVFNAGNYQLKHFIKFGIPVSVTYSTAAITLIPLIFPF
ncbi:SLC13 family permease [Thalassotalea mangrovi]|uniref:SLC13 family permease n=1 Tax=Thalassotalea mangrovi TaxID=2572245 RepID=A0A4U1B6Q0_9GAMM|nr:SLC13 family permease [Thalassotalea mangrovi]TKB46130.1 SLC13 family permease [Thalassotalea mangrovi]